jgi:uncharacterized protein YodC (DUF2158 family)
MAFEPGDIVMLKSGGQPMTVVATSEDEITCLWIGDEGELFRESIPVVALESVPTDDDEDDDEHEDEDEHEDDEDEEKTKKQA